MKNVRTAGIAWIAALVLAVAAAHPAVIEPEETPGPYRRPPIGPAPAPPPALPGRSTAASSSPAAGSPRLPAVAPPGAAIPPAEAPRPRSGPIRVSASSSSTESPPPLESGNPAEFEDESWRERPTISLRLPYAPPLMPPPTSASLALEPPQGAGLMSDELAPGGETAPAGPKSNFDLLGEELRKRIKEMDWGGGRLAAYVEDAEHPIGIFDLDGATPMVPASCQKLVTVAAALDRLGGDHQFVTPIEASGKIENRVLTGNLIVRGSGDPSLSSRHEPGARGVLAPFRDWARRLKDCGVDSIRGHLIGDASAFSGPARGPDWPEALVGEWLSAEVSALTFNDNLIEFRWAPGKGQDRKAQYDLEPRFDRIQVRDGVKIDERARRNWRVYARDAESNLFDVLGYLPARTAAVDLAALHDPPQFFMWALKAALADEGVAVSGTAVVLSQTAIPDLATSGSWRLFTHCSPPLSQLAAPILGYDQHLRAELLFAALGRACSGDGSFIGGNRAVGEWMIERGLSRAGTIAVDGSGLSPLDRLTAKQLVQLLKTMARRPAGGAFFAAFPQGGRPGILANRFQESGVASEIAPRVFAMAGFMPGAHSLAGWTTTAGGRKLYFAFTLNGSILGKTAAREDLDQLALAIAQSPLRKMGTATYYP